MRAAVHVAKSRPAARWATGSVGSRPADAIERHILRVDVPVELISNMLGSWAEATMDLIVLKAAMAKK